MKSRLVVHENPREMKATRVNFTKKEQQVLDSYSVKTATQAAVTAWKTVKKDSRAFTNKLKKVHSVMTKDGNSPKSLFSKWLKSVGIPRSTAYWTLKQAGAGSGKKQPSVKHLLKQREQLQLKLANAKKDEKDEVKQKLESVKSQLSRRQEVLQNKIDRLQADLKELIKGVATFAGTSEGKKTGDELLDSLQELGLVRVTLSRGPAPIYSFNSNGTVSTTEKKPAASVRPTVQQMAQA